MNSLTVSSAAVVGRKSSLASDRRSALRNRVSCDDGYVIVVRLFLLLVFVPIFMFMFMFLFIFIIRMLPMLLMLLILQMSRILFWLVLLSVLLAWRRERVLAIESTQRGESFTCHYPIGARFRVVPFHLPPSRRQRLPRSRFASFRRAARFGPLGDDGRSDGTRWRRRAAFSDFRRTISSANLATSSLRAARAVRSASSSACSRSSLRRVVCVRRCSAASAASCSFLPASAAASSAWSWLM